MVLEYENSVLPAVIVLKKYVSTMNRSYACNRRNVVHRDNNICQYCGNRFCFSDLTMDHVIPKSKGGLKSWTNIVASCKRCNSRKRDRTPEEARMPLIKQPQVPRWTIEVLLRDKEVPSEWDHYI